MARRRELTVREITRSARQLTDEHGLDGFTMEDLAQAVGVSRRTLFNYVPGKIDAVLGNSTSAQDSEAISVFRTGGPTGNLIDDVRQVSVSILRLNEEGPEQIALLRRLLRNDTRLLNAVYERLGQIVQVLTQAITDRERDDLDPYSARVLARITLTVFGMAVDEFLADPSITVADHFVNVFDTMIGLFD